MANRISICIPRVDISCDKDFINNIFNKTNLGIIQKIDIVPNHKEKLKFNRVFVHFSEMTSEFHKNILESGKTIKIIHDFPWFWKCSLSRHI